MAMKALNIVVMLVFILIFASKAVKAAFCCFAERAAWSDGERHNLTYIEKNGPGLELITGDTGYVREGIFVTPIVTVDETFSRLVASWNILTPDDTYAVIEAKVKVKGDNWSDWYTMGTWGTGIDSASKSCPPQKETRFFAVDIDTFVITHPAGADQYQLKITLVSPAGDKTPYLYRVGAVAYKDARSEKVSTKLSTVEKELPVPMKSQMDEDDAIKNVVCSPTCLAMVLSYWGHDEPVASVARNVFDNGARIYGNWSFNVAYAGSLGYKSYVDHYADLEGIKLQILRGVPVIASIRFKEGELTNAPIKSSNGHLVLVRGFKTVDGIEYVIVNDPAAKGELVRREYPAREFEKVWRGIVYITEPKSDEN